MDCRRIRRPIAPFARGHSPAVALRASVHSPDSLIPWPRLLTPKEKSFLLKFSPEMAAANMSQNGTFGFCIGHNEDGVVLYAGVYATIFVPSELCGNRVFPEYKWYGVEVKEVRMPTPNGASVTNSLRGASDLGGAPVRRQSRGDFPTL